MFADGSKVPYDRTRLLIQKLAAPLKATPLRVTSSATPRRVSSRRERVRRVRSLGRSRQCGAPDPRARGAAADPIFAVAGKADSQPLFPDDPTLPANRRVTITLMRECRHCRRT